MHIKVIKPELKKAALLAFTEKRFSCDNVAEELLLLLNEYFIGRFQQKGNRIKLNFLNGQSFVLSISKV